MPQTEIAVLASALKENLEFVKDSIVQLRSQLEVDSTKQQNTQELLTELRLTVSILESKIERISFIEKQIESLTPMSLTLEGKALVLAIQKEVWEIKNELAIEKGQKQAVNWGWGALTALPGLLALAATIIKSLAGV